MANEGDQPIELARRLLGRELEDGRDLAQVAEAGERVCQKLYGTLATLVGPLGFQTTLAYALRHAAIRHAILNGVEAGVGGGRCLNGLAERAQDQDPVHLLEAVVDLLGELLSLLARLIGRELVDGALRSTWPDP